MPTTFGTVTLTGAAGELLTGGDVGGALLVLVLVLVLADVGGVTDEFEVVGPPDWGVPLSRLKM
jgi:hypothetical protein